MPKQEAINYLNEKVRDDDEPVFVFRAQDIFMAQILRHWVRLVRDAYDRDNQAGDPTKVPRLSDAQAEKLSQALSVAVAAEKWSTLEVDDKTQQKGETDEGVPIYEKQVILRSKVPD